MAKAIGIQHVQISIAPGKEQASRDFYLGLLGLVEMIDPFNAPGGLWAKAGTQEIHLRVEQNVDRDATRAHTAVQVDELAVVERDLKARGFEIIPQPKIVGFNRFHTIDPSGNRIEIMQAE